MMRRQAALGGLLALTMVAAVVPAAGAGARATRVLPPAGARFDYQLGGAYPPPAGVEIVSRDRTARPATGLYNVCYVNAFQTQPDENAWWQRNHPELLLRRGGRLVTDPGWPGERILDTSTAAKRARLAAIVGRWIAGCRRAGFAAVEPDNLDSYTRSKGRLTRAMNLAYARLLVRRAHDLGLAIAQKNLSEIAPVGHARIGFDFAVAEECQVYRECASYIRGYGRRVYEIEYSDNGGIAGFRAACSRGGPRISIVYRDRDLTVPGSASYVYRTC